MTTTPCRDHACDHRPTGTACLSGWAFGCILARPRWIPPPNGNASSSGSHGAVFNRCGQPTVHTNVHSIVHICPWAGTRGCATLIISRAGTRRPRVTRAADDRRSAVAGRGRERGRPVGTSASMRWRKRRVSSRSGQPADARGMCRDRRNCKLLVTKRYLSCKPLLARCCRGHIGPSLATGTRAVRDRCPDWGPQRLQWCGGSRHDRSKASPMDDQAQPDLSCHCPCLNRRGDSYRAVEKEPEISFWTYQRTCALYRSRS